MIYAYALQHGFILSFIPWGNLSPVLDYEIANFFAIMSTVYTSFHSFQCVHVFPLSEFTGQKKKKLFLNK